MINIQLVLQISDMPCKKVEYGVSVKNNLKDV